MAFLNSRRWPSTTSDLLPVKCHDQERHHAQPANRWTESFGNLCAHTAYPPHHVGKFLFWRRAPQFRKAIIATGARAACCPFRAWRTLDTSQMKTVFSLTALPRRLIVIGGGPIGCELAQTFVRLGSQVSLVSDIPRLLPKEDTDVAALLEQQFRREGIELILGAKVERAEKSAVGKS